MYTNVTQRGNQIYVRGVKDGRRYSGKVDFNPTLWVNSKVKNATDKWQTLDGQTVYSIQPGSINDCKDFIQQNEARKLVHGMKVLDIYESPGHTYQYIAEEWPGELRFDPQDISVFTIDIETETEYGFPDPTLANEVIQLITVKDTRHSKATTWGLHPFDNDLDYVEYRYFQTEQSLLKDFIVWWQQNCPDVVTGWNSRFFDLPYLYNRMCKILTDKIANKLSPWGQCRLTDTQQFGTHDKVRHKLSISGIADLDYLELYRKFTYSAQESYRLDYIAGQELGENKLENPGSSFKEFYTDHWDTFVRYNIRDVELVDKLDDKMKLMDLALTLAYAAKVNYEDVFSPVRTWDIIIYNYLNDRKVIVPPRKQGEKAGNYQGAYVKDPLIGKHNWCCSFDLNSLYPHLIMQYNMSPETIVKTMVEVIDPETDEKEVEEVNHIIPLNLEQLLTREEDLSYAIENNYAIAANGSMYRKDKRGLLPTQMQLFYDKRVIYKNEMLQAKQQYADTKDPKWAKEISRLNNLQMAMKILLNSAYGAMGNAYFRYFDMSIAEGITISGQLSIRWIANKLNQYFDKLLKTDGVDRIVLIDTDSVVMTLNDLVQKVYGVDGKISVPTEKVIEFMDKIAEQKIQPFLDESYEELADYMNAYEQKMQMKRENLADVMISVSKKRYVMSVHNSEGVQYKEPQLKVMGLQMVKSSTPAVIRQKLKESLNTILYGTEDDVQQYVYNYRKEFSELNVEDIAFPRSISDVKKYQSATTVYTKGTPIHVRGALLYNHYLKQKKLEKQYPLIREGDKIKFTYLKSSNPFHEDCISFVDKLPPEFELSKYVDYDKMFEKTFQDAVQNILESLGWSAEQKSTLEDWFS